MEKNPVVLLNGRTWHIVEHSRSSQQALCGQALRDRRAHSRLRTIGRENLCPACRKSWQEEVEN
jgi:hypothetical protein